MVEDIHFSDRIPPVSSAGGVKKVNRKKREQEKPPFEKFLDGQDRKNKQKNKGKNDSNDVVSSDNTQKMLTSTSAEATDSSDPSETEEGDGKKIIDIRI